MVDGGASTLMTEMDQLNDDEKVGLEVTVEATVYISRVKKKHCKSPVLLYMSHARKKCCISHAELMV